MGEKNDYPRATSKYLIEALGPVGVNYETPKGIRKTDLSYSDALTALIDWKEARKQEEINIHAGRDMTWGLHPKDVLVDFLQYVAPVLERQTRSGKNNSFELNSALQKVFNRRNDHYLKKIGWDVTDLMTWAWILSGNTTERAAARLACIGELSFKGSEMHQPPPHFVYSFLLRRQSMSALALSKILEFLWIAMPQFSKQKARADEEKNIDQDRAQGESKQRNGMKDFIFMVIIMRLLRNARQVMPVAYESIVSLFCRYLDDCVFITKLQEGDQHSELRLAGLTFMYNSVLASLALPTSLQAFRSAVHQQRAQFMILRKMAQYDPPLLVDRRGYRAVARVQLMQKKTTIEREWALFKALSWPPWKENRLGIDADIGPEFGISKAKEVLNQAEEAGYAADGWDGAASILAGWDTDDSPTIQTRAILAEHKPDRFENIIWAARIKATRTVQEAWAGFLSYEDSKIERHAGVYYYMFEKLFSDAKRISSQKRQKKERIEDQRTDQILPGDGLEVSPTPIAPHHMVYNRTPPPSIEIFFQRMIDHGLIPTARSNLLRLLLRNAPSLALGFRFLKASNLPQEHTNVLLKQPTSVGHDFEKNKLLQEVPAKLFAAVVDLLARGAWSRSLLIDGLDCGAPFESIIKKYSEGPKPSRAIAPLWRPASQAIWLVLERRPRDRPPWYSVLAALARTGIISPLDTCSACHSYSAIANWKTSTTILYAMEELYINLDLTVLKILCTGLEKAIFEAEYLSSQMNCRENVEDSLRDDLKLVLDLGLPRVKSIFKNIVRSDRMQQDIPPSILESHHRDESPPQGRLRDDEPIPRDDNDNLLEDADDDWEGGDEEPSERAPANFLPPACLTPKLLEVPDPAQLHSFIRILGLRRDYQGLWDLIEWMALFSNEIRAVMEEQQNGPRMMRRCLIATRVFLERSWFSYRDSDDEKTWLDELVNDVGPAPLEILHAVRDTILETQDWGGWPTDAEVERYCLNGRFL